MGPKVNPRSRCFDRCPPQIPLERPVTAVDAGAPGPTLQALDAQMQQQLRLGQEDGPNRRDLTKPKDEAGCEMRSCMSGSAATDKIADQCAVQ